MGLKELAEIKRVEILLDKYWRGASSREEEAVLKSYFTGDNVAGHLKYIQPLFVALQENKSGQLGNNFDRDLQKKISPKKTGHFLRPGKPISKNIIKIAAAVVLLSAVTYLFQSKNTNRDINVEKAQLGTFDNPEEAYEQVRKSLQLVSAKLNKGNDYVKGLSKFNKGATLFNKQKKQKTSDEQ